MNKTVNINLAGIFFHIDEDAYLKLQRYLEAIKRSFTDSQGRSEIISDIEARIAELFSERIQNDKQVVGVKLVDVVITIMGQPEDYLVDDEIFEDEPQQKRQTKSGPNKTLYRDTDNSYVGGVASGFSHYLGIDMIWVRLLWVLFTFLSGGTFIIIYLICWALIPEAKTTAEKLTMTGEAVNISNIEKKIKDGFDSVSDKLKNVDFKKHSDNLKEGFENVADNISETVKSVDFDKQSNRLKNKSRNFFETIGDIIMFFLKIFAKFFGIIMIIVGVSTLIALLVGFFTVGVTDVIHFPGIDFLEIGNAANIPIWLMSLLLFLAIGIPFFFLFYLGLKILVNNLKSIGNPAKFTLLGLWIISILGLIVTGIKQASEHAFDAETVSKKELSITANDTLKISVAGYDRYDNYYYRNHNNFKLIEDDEGRKIVSNDIKLIVYSTTDSVAKITIVKEASGSSYRVAKERADNINYSYGFANKELKLEAYHTTDVDNKYSEQQVRIIVYLPEGSTLIVDKDLSRYIRRTYRSYNSIIYNTNYGKYLKVKQNEVECLDCEYNEVNESKSTNFSNNDKTSLKINSEEGIVIKTGDSVKLKIDSDGIKANGSDIQVKIDDKNGVEIKSKNDN
ncbi:hypothetical protein BTO05_13240 [Winogradskyella sp. PC-19]|uniref:PspC domain-containing protein n=1 Tax=unclassified Winogradskyella TaxID=2615021 RepID=UPI000B3D1748|nr:MULTISPECIES: PspC domain-containing protein [unclassified Winogradskyella]ARV10550.1 hypothetical protein BTO05_13240 [Winogradskyella sp. PC-19]RZN82283.1 MAG: PspC domain-containing protein [Winogradskyella sp.]